MFLLYLVTKIDVDKKASLFVIMAHVTRVVVSEMTHFHMMSRSTSIPHIHTMNSIQVTRLGHDGPLFSLAKVPMKNQSNAKLQNTRNCISNITLKYY